MPTTEYRGLSITRWSYSRYSNYAKCPLRAKYLYIDGLPDPSGPAAKRGEAVHKELEKFVTSKRPSMKRLSTALLKHNLCLGPVCGDVIFSMAKGDLLCAEAEWAFTKGFRDIVPWDSDKAWCRMKADAARTDGPGAVLVVDYKTGREYPTHAEQAELYALGSFLYLPKIVSKNLRVAFLYLDADVKREWCFSRRKDVGRLKRKWIDKTMPMLTDVDFKPTPSDDACRWCAFSKRKGGVCSAG